MSNSVQVEASAAASLHRHPSIAKLRAWHAKWPWWPRGLQHVYVKLSIVLTILTASLGRDLLRPIKLGWHMLVIGALALVCVFSPPKGDELWAALFVGFLLLIALPRICFPIPEVIVLAIAGILILAVRTLVGILTRLAFVALWIEGWSAKSSGLVSNGGWVARPSQMPLHFHSKSAMKGLFWLRRQMTQAPACTTYLVVRLAMGTIRRMPWLRTPTRTLVRMNYTLD